MDRASVFFTSECLFFFNSLNWCWRLLLVGQSAFESELEWSKWIASGREVVALRGSGSGCCLLATSQRNVYPLTKPVIILWPSSPYFFAKRSDIPQLQNPIRCFCLDFFGGRAVRGWSVSENRSQRGCSMLIGLVLCEGSSLCCAERTLGHLNTCLHSRCVGLRLYLVNSWSIYRVKVRFEFSGGEIVKEIMFLESKDVLESHWKVVKTATPNASSNSSLDESNFFKATLSNFSGLALQEATVLWQSIKMLLTCPFNHIGWKGEPLIALADV